MQIEHERAALAEIEAGMNLPKCRKCGCMKDALQATGARGSSELKDKARAWLKRLDSIEYSCLGCKHCYGANAINSLDEGYSGACLHGNNDQTSTGEYFILSKKGFVAISTLGSQDLAEKIANSGIKEVFIAGKTETENIGIEKVVRTIIRNPQISHLFLVGKESQGHLSGEAIVSLMENGVDEDMRIIGSHARKPFLRNLSHSEVEAFRKSMSLIDMRGCERIDLITDKIKGLKSARPCKCHECGSAGKNSKQTEVIHAEKQLGTEMDKAGYFLIIPDNGKKCIVVEHYNYDNKLLRVIKGRNATDIYLRIIQNKWITQHSHAAYIGKELAKAEQSIMHVFKYVQD